MSFEVTDDLLHQYATQGYAVLRKIIPTALLRDLRIEAEKALRIARETAGPNAQRLQPIANHVSLNAKPFEDYANLPDLLAAIRKLAGDDAWIGGPSRMGILFEPAERPWCTAWHRDFGPYQRRVEMDTFRKMRVNPRYFHQVNCALYEDTCTWYVPGSHLRDDFTPEAEIGQNSPWQVGMDMLDATMEEVERHCLSYVQSMPRAICLALDAGDFALYRSHGWHLGNYVPYKRRATLHDSVWTPEWKAAYEKWGEGGLMEPGEVTASK